MTDLAKAIAAMETPFCDKHESATPSGTWVLDIDDARSLERERAYALGLLRERWAGDRAESDKAIDAFLAHVGAGT